MTTEDQLICYVGMAKKESGENMNLALSLVKERYVKKGEEVPKLNILDDRCCNSPLAAGSRFTGPFVDAGLSSECGHKDFLHTMLLATKTMRPANMKDMAAPRKLLIQITRGLYFHPPRSVPEMVNLAAKYVEVSNAALLATITRDNLEARVGDELLVARFIVKSNHASNKDTRTVRAALIKLRSSDSYNKYVRRHRRSKESQTKEAENWLQEIELGQSARVVQTKKVMRTSSDHSTGYVDFLRRQLHHIRRGCCASGLPFEKQYICIPPKTAGGLVEYGVVETQSPIEGINRRLGDITRGTSSLRQVAIERRAGIEVFTLVHKRRVKLGYAVLGSDPFDFLFEDVNTEIVDLWGTDATAWNKNSTNSDYGELEPMFFDYQKAMNEEKYIKLVTDTLARVKEEKAASSSSSFSSTSFSSSSFSSTSSTSSTSNAFSSSTSSASNGKDRALSKSPTNPAAVLSTSSSSSSTSFQSKVAPKVVKFSNTFSNFKNKNLSTQNPKHTPSKPHTLEGGRGTFSSDRWTSAQCTFVVSSLVNLRGVAGTAKWKREQVQREWVTKAMDVNDDDFNLNGIPSEDEIRMFSQQIAVDVDEIQLADSIQEKPLVNNKNTRKAKVYHSNDVKNDDPYYLVFPLKDASKSNQDQGTGSTTGLTNRRMMAYSAALGVTGKIPRRREKLQAMILATDGVGIARPSSRGIDWTTWTYES